MKGKNDKGIERIQCYYIVIKITIMCILTHTCGYCNHWCYFIVDAGNSSGINIAIYEQSISTKGIQFNFITQ